MAVWNVERNADRQARLHAGRSLRHTARTLIFGGLAVGLFLAASNAFGQLDSANLQPRPPAATKPANPPAPVAKSPTTSPAVPAQPKKKLPPPQAVSLKTRDGVLLAATYLPSPLEKEMQKDAVPVLLLHPFKGSRADFNDLALTLQEAGCAVLVPDLRGHGQSTRRINADGKEVEIEQALMNHQDFEAMGYADTKTSGDVEACNKFLRAKNNLKELNIDKLVIIGAEMGAGVAVNWAQSDWSWPVLPGAPKQGQDVKALILLSPQWSFRGLGIGNAVGDHDFAGKLSWMIVVGEQDSKEYPEAKRLFLALTHVPLPLLADAPGRPAVSFHAYPTSLQGAQLLARNFNTTAEILKFIDQQVTKTVHPWTDRKSPLD